MFSQSLSQLTIVKLFLAHAIKPSSCGTLWLSASTPSKKMVIPIGFRAFVSRQIRSIQSLLVAAGIVPLKYGTWQTANWNWITMGTMDIWTLSLYRLMDLCVHPVAKIARPSCGIWMMASTCILWITMTSSMPCASHQTVTGCALPTDHPLRSGIWHARKWLRNYVQASPELIHQRQILHNAYRSHGQLMVKLFLLAIATTRFVFGKCQSLPVKYTAFS